MIEYRLEKLDPHPVRVPGCRVQEAQWAVVHGNRLVALFCDETRADNYARRLNAWHRQATGAKA